ncbi:unnamed protein product [Didymodactylos carnosus]|uniref:Uncharacterized protein n=1 Tax=Didymodactylos carnosus TaxID=1234261 RepID=A0A814NXC5_9BILA|nr:unnamed protein product [Didymodactylos carnosus]CAF1099379.1 unnamed protein product [Didymodactylos carnosus]CAF3839679.1 unnamed protein product [Didymodactylos carnosus]CAF3864390.1 unnamed protein product [Didymodactylos carnosus]
MEKTENVIEPVEQEQKDKVIIQEQPKIPVNEVKIEPLPSTEGPELQRLRGGGGIGHAILNGIVGAFAFFCALECFNLCC